MVNRTVNGGTVRYIEKMAKDSEVKPDTTCKVMDAFTSGVNGPASTTIAVGTHLEGESVVVWADGEPLVETVAGRSVPLEYTVDASGNITVASAVTNWVAGLPYTARYKSARLAYGATSGTAMLQKKRVCKIGFVMNDFVRAGINYGSEFDNADRPLYPLTALQDGITAQSVVLSDIQDEELMTFPGSFDTDSRICFEIKSPNTANVLGMVLEIQTND